MSFSAFPEAQYPSRLQRLAVAAGLLLLPAAGHAQATAPVGTPPAPALAPPPAARLSGSYRYTAYTVFDTTNPDEPTQVAGVGGTLALRPDGTYAKRLALRVNLKPLVFAQEGTWELRGDSIRFAFRDQKGADVQRGLARLDTLTHHLTLTILGYPVGNQGVYELEAMPVAPAPVALPGQPKPLPGPAKRRRVRKVKSK